MTAPTQIFLQDCSSNGVRVNQIKVGTNQMIPLADGSRIDLLQNTHLSATFHILSPKAQSISVASGSDEEDPSEAERRKLKRLEPRSSSIKKRRNPDYLEEGEIVNKRWDIGNIIGQGTFSRIFVATDIQTQEKVAVKMEKAGLGKGILTWESKVLLDCQGSNLVCKHLEFGNIEGRGHYMVLQLFKDNASTYRKAQPKGFFEVKPGARLAVQMLQALEYFHSKGYVHRDVKPSNFLIPHDYGEGQDSVAIVDFGLAKLHVQNGSIVPARPKVQFRGSSLYASLQAHSLADLGFVDDLWSFLFVVIDFVTGNLPWRDCKEYREVTEKKKREYCGGVNIPPDIPAELKEFMNYLKLLCYDSRINYEYLRDLLVRLENSAWEPSSSSSSSSASSASSNIASSSSSSSMPALSASCSALSLSTFYPDASSSAVDCSQDFSGCNNPYMAAFRQGVYPASPRPPPDLASESHAPVSSPFSSCPEPALPNPYVQSYHMHSGYTFPTNPYLEQ